MKRKRGRLERIRYALMAIPPSQWGSPYPKHATYLLACIDRMRQTMERMRREIHALKYGFEWTCRACGRRLPSSVPQCSCGGHAVEICMVEEAE